MDKKLNSVLLKAIGLKRILPLRILGIRLFSKGSRAQRDANCAPV
jgi:hypothetical protein